MIETKFRFILQGMRKLCALIFLWRMTSSVKKKTPQQTNPNVFKGMSRLLNWIGLQGPSSRRRREPPKVSCAPYLRLLFSHCAPVHKWGGSRSLRAWSGASPEVHSRQPEKTGLRKCCSFLLQKWKFPVRTPEHSEKHFIKHILIHVSKTSGSKE